MFGSDFVYSYYIISAFPSDVLSVLYLFFPVHITALSPILCTYDSDIRYYVFHGFVARWKLKSNCWILAKKFLERNYLKFIMNFWSSSTKVFSLRREHSVLVYVTQVILFMLTHTFI